MIKFELKENIPKIGYSHVIKFWEREYSIFTISTFAKMLELLNSSQLGENVFKTFLCFYKDAKSFHYRSVAEEEEFEKIIGQKIINNKKFINKIIGSHTFFAKELLLYFEKIKKDEIFSVTFIKNFADLFGNFAAANTAIQRSADYLVKFVDQKENLRKLIRQRTRYEHVMAYFEHYYGLICKKIIKDKKIELDNLKLLTAEEVVCFLKSGKLPRDLMSRREMVVIFILPQLIIVSGDAAMKFYNSMNRQKKGSKIKIISGMGIYGERIIGKAQVIINPTDFRKIKRGRILVTYTTLPQYNLFLNKVVGIVTDEGGILTHSAVFCREFKIPGIVGTKNATKLIKNNQLIELDPTSGLVKIIK